MSHRPSALFQLVSEQTMPNVLAALALEPEHITLLHTPRTAPQASWINHALRLAGLQFEIDLRALSASPDVNETGTRVRTACEDALQAGLAPVVNITGGTKLMSIGAFAATISRDWPSIYVDTDNRRILQVGHHAPPELLRDGFAALSRAEAKLNVDVVAAAHGCEHVSSGEDPSPFVEFAEFLRMHPAEELTCHSAFKGIHTRGKPAELLAVLDCPLPQLRPAVSDRALAAGLLESRGESLFLACPTRATIERACQTGVDPADYFSATRPLQFAQAFFSGGWWEICVWHAARQSGAFRDLRWSVRFGTETDHLEEDIVAISGLNLAVFSCKRGGAGERLNRAFEEFVAASNRLGGTFAAKYFCVAMVIKDAQFVAVRSEAARLRVRLVNPANRLTPSSFVST